MSGDRVDHVIAAIDGALSDWSVSGDAMRWQPPAESAEPTPMIVDEVFIAPAGTPPPAAPVAYFEWSADTTVCPACRATHSRTRDFGREVLALFPSGRRAGALRRIRELDERRRRWEFDRERVRTAVQSMGDSAWQADVLVDQMEAVGVTAAQLADAVEALTVDNPSPDLLLADDLGPVDPRARALQLRRTRNTGPSRDVVRQHRPRRG